MSLPGLDGNDHPNLVIKLKVESGVRREVCKQTQSARLAQADLFVMCCLLFIQLLASDLSGYQVWMVYHPNLVMTIQTWSTYLTPDMQTRKKLIRAKTFFLVDVMLEGDVITRFGWYTIQTW